MPARSVAVPRVPETIGLLIIGARQTLRHAMGAHARAFRLTPQQFWAVVAAHRMPGAAPGDLADRLLLDRPAASRVIAELVRRGLAVVRPDAEDRRRGRVTLTASGEALAAQLVPLADDIRRTIVRGMTEAEVETLRDLLRRVADNLATIAGQADAERTDEDDAAASGS